MNVARQLGTCGMVVAFAPLLWIGACLVSVALAQNAYDQSIVPRTRMHRLAEGPEVMAPPRPPAPPLVQDPHVLTELEKYVRIWALQPGACEEFPVGDRVPWSWNPFKGSALMLRLKQKQAFLLMQHHEVKRLQVRPGRYRYYFAPDPQAALGGRRFLVETDGVDLDRAWELP